MPFVTADGGFRPAFNVQLATDESGVIVGVDVVNSGTDHAQSLPMLKQIEARTGRKVTEYLMDGGFTTLEAIETAAEGRHPLRSGARPQEER